MSRGTCSFLITLSLAVGAIAQSQPESQARPFRVKVTLVPVDVLVVDRRGRPVQGLGPADFVIFEDGVPQKIVYFAEGHGSAPRQEADLAENLGVGPESLRTPTARSFLIYLGRGRHANNFKAARHLADFVEKKLNPQDRVAVMAYNRSTEFTTDHARVAQAVRGYEEVNADIEAKLDTLFRGLAGIYRDTSLPTSLQQTIDQVFLSHELATVQLGADEKLERGVGRSSASTAEALSRIEALDRFSENSRLFQGVGEAADAVFTPPLEPSPFDRALRDAITDLPFEEYVEASSRMRFDVGNIWSAIDYLATIEGEKHLIAFTEGGWNLGRHPEDGLSEAPEVTLARLASHARVRLHIIDTARMGRIEARRTRAAEVRTIAPSDFRWARVRGLDSSYSAMSTRKLAQLTGGQAFAHRYVDGVLDSILAATEAYYLLGYSPPLGSNPTFRDIEVEVRRKGLRVLHRAGYYTESSRQHTDRERVRMQRLTLAAAETEGELTGILLASRAARRPLGNSPPGIDLTTLVTLEPETLVLNNDRYEGHLALLYAPVSEEGEILLTVWDRFEVSLRPEAYLRALQASQVQQADLQFRFNKHLAVSPGLVAKAIKIVVLDYRRGRIGSLTVPIAEPIQ